MPYKDPEKRREWQRNYIREKYKNNAEFRKRVKAETRKTCIVNTSVAKELIAEFRKDGCSNCPEIDHDCLCAHHKDPKDKKFDIGRMASGNYSRNNIILELKKCLCLCLNCHAKLHARQRRRKRKKEINSAKKKL